MPSYFVMLQVQNGNYEKITKHLVNSSSEDEAAKEALINECHHSLDEGADWLEEGQQIEDAYGEMIYTLHSVEPVNSYEYVTLNKFM